MTEALGGEARAVAAADDASDTVCDMDGETDDRNETRAGEKVE